MPPRGKRISIITKKDTYSPCTYKYHTAMLEV